jgi:hypothetical protein
VRPQSSPNWTSQLQLLQYGPRLLQMPISTRYGRRSTESVLPCTSIGEIQLQGHKVDQIRADDEYSGSDQEGYSASLDDMSNWTKEDWVDYQNSTFSLFRTTECQLASTYVQTLPECVLTSRFSFAQQIKIRIKTPP